jgi:mRNA-degrading endonuclease toxin of MazEF toxin-antitoxin module
MLHSELTPFSSNAIYNTEKIVEFGEVYLVNDYLVSMPETDRTDRRTYHNNGRIILIIQNDETNYDPVEYPFIIIAPLTSKTKTKRAFDIELFVKDETVIDVDVLVKLRLMQPVLRSDLGECLGEISSEKLEEVVAAFNEMFGLIE